MSMNLRHTGSAAIAVGLFVALQAGAMAGASATTGLKIVSVLPNPVSLTITTIPGSAAKSYAVAWSGTATFPMTVNVVPKPGCSTATWTCHKSTKVFTVRSSKLYITSSCAVGAGSLSLIHI